MNLNKTRASVLSIACLLAGLPLAIVHCGGSSGASVGGDDGGDDSTSGDDTGSSSGGSSGGSSGSGSGSGSGSSGGSSSGGSSGSGSGSSSGGADGGGCVVPDGGEPCNPGVVACGTSTCKVPGSFCCVSPNKQAACDTDGQACNGSEYHCKEAADCPSGDVCCAQVSGGGGQGATTTCVATKCTAPAFQICRSDTECAQGKCIVQKCPTTTANVEACVLLPGCTAL